MNKNVLLTALLISFVGISCTVRDKKTENVPVQDQTPEVLENKSADIDLKAISRRYEDDLVQKLFEEAMDKDPGLKSITDRIEEIDKTKKDSLESYYKYLRTNKNYWMSANRYISRLKDSTFKKEMQEAFDRLESNYNNSISMYDSKVEQIASKSDMLDDKMILMKLAVTAKMIYNYQQNELPEISTFENLIKSYNDIIEETKPFIEFKK